MSNQLTRRDFAIRSAGFGLALGLAPAAMLAEAEQAVKEIFLDGLSNSGSVVRRPSEGVGNPPALKAMKGRPRLPPYSRSMAS
jgi:hypothetical protein